MVMAPISSFAKALGLQNFVNHESETPSNTPREPMAGYPSSRSLVLTTIASEDDSY